MNRIVKQIQDLNDDVEIEEGGQHLKVYKDGEFVGILPRKSAKEGLALNTKCQFRRAGIKLPGDRRAA